MTAIIAIDYLTEILIIADTRISTIMNGKQKYVVNWGLKKLTPIISPDGQTVLVLGFSGDVKLARKVFKFLFVDKKISTYSRRFVISHIKDDIFKWISEFVESEWAKPNTYSLTNFLLCGLEPKLNRPLRDINGKSVKWPFTPFKPSHIYTYSISNSGKVLLKNHKPMAIIGSGKYEQEEKINEIRERLIGFGRGDTEMDNIRAWQVMREIAFTFEDANSKTVGGAFQVIRLSIPSKNNVEIWRWMATPGSTPENVEVIDKNDTIIMKTRTKKFTIDPIWKDQGWHPTK